MCQVCVKNSSNAKHSERMTTCECYFATAVQPKSQTSVCSAYCVRSLEPAGERNHWASAESAEEDPPQLDWFQDGSPGSFGSHRRKELYPRLGTDAAVFPYVIRMWYSPEICSEQRQTK